MTHGLIRRTEFHGDYSFVFEPCNDGGFTAYCEELPDVTSAGRTLEEARQNLARELARADA